MGKEEEFHANITVPFPTAREADIAYKVLKVDAEPKRSQASKDMKVKDNTLLVNFSAPKYGN